MAQHADDGCWARADVVGPAKTSHSLNDINICFILYFLLKLLPKHSVLECCAVDFTLHIRHYVPNCRELIQGERVWAK